MVITHSSFHRAFADFWLHFSVSFIICITLISPCIHNVSIICIHNIDHPHLSVECGVKASVDASNASAFRPFGPFPKRVRYVSDASMMNQRREGHGPALQNIAHLLQPRMPQKTRKELPSAKHLPKHPKTSQNIM